MCHIEKLSSTFYVENKKERQLTLRATLCTQVSIPRNTQYSGRGGRGGRGRSSNTGRGGGRSNGGGRGRGNQHNSTKKSSHSGQVQSGCMKGFFFWRYSLSRYNQQKQCTIAKINNIPKVFIQQIVDHPVY